MRRYVAGSGLIICGLAFGCTVDTGVLPGPDPAAVAVTVDGASGAVVALVFHNSDGTIAAIVEEAATGSALLPDGGSVTVLLAESGRRSLTTISSVEPGDRLLVRSSLSVDQLETVLIEVPVTLPQGATVDVDVGCANGTGGPGETVELILTSACMRGRQDLSMFVSVDPGDSEAESRFLLTTVPAAPSAAPFVLPEWGPQWTHGVTTREIVLTPQYDRAHSAFFHFYPRMADASFRSLDAGAVANVVGQEQFRLTMFDAPFESLEYEIRLSIAPQVTEGYSGTLAIADSMDLDLSGVWVPSLIHTEFDPRSRTVLWETKSSPYAPDGVSMTLSWFGDDQSVVRWHRLGPFDGEGEARWQLPLLPELYAAWAPEGAPDAQRVQVFDDYRRIGYGQIREDYFSRGALDEAIPMRFSEAVSQ